MQSGVRYKFPPFEGKYSKFNNLPVNVCEGLPMNPDIKQVYVVHGVSKEVSKCDGWIWAKGNKSDKTFFSNVAAVQKALKYKCATQGCKAVRFIDMVLKYDLMRVYYENTYEHETANANKSGMKSEGNIVDNINRVGGGNVSKSKRKR